MHLELIAFLAGLISSTAAIPQIFRMRRTRKTGGVSTFMFCMKNCSNTLWLLFGILSGTYSIIFWNVISTTLCTTVIVMKYKILRDKARAEAEVIKRNNIIAMPIYVAVDNLKAELEKPVPPRPALRLVYSRPKEVQQDLPLEMPQDISSGAPAPQA
jgi:MtN3 and saliva related transmembrane protein